MKKKDYRNVIYQTTSDRPVVGEDWSAIRKEIGRKFPVWHVHYGKHLPENKDADILEIGCGWGDFIYCLEQWGYKNVLGVDISEDRVSRAVHLGINHVIKDDFRNILKDPKRKGRYDVIVARDVLEHFQKDEVIEIIQLVYDALASRGRFLIQTVNAESPMGMGFRYGAFTHEIGFTRTSLKQILEIAGLRQIRSYPVEPVPAYSCISAIRSPLWKCIDWVLKAYQLVETGSGNGIFTRNLITVGYKI